jgi:hypothetical protein
MGFSNSWLAIKAPPEEVLAHLSLGFGAASETPGLPNDGAEISSASLPLGWFLLFLGTYDHPLAQPAAVRAFPHSWEVLACKIEEHVMASDASLYRLGELVWSVEHTAERGIYDLTVRGNPPDTFTPLKDRVIREQEQEGGQDADVDLVFGIPIVLAQQTCGFRHDLFKFEWGQPAFEELVRRR